MDITHKNKTNVALSQRNQYFLSKINGKYQHHELSAVPLWILPLLLPSPMTYNIKKGYAGMSHPSPLVGGDHMVIPHPSLALPRGGLSWPSMPSALFIWTYPLEEDCVGNTSGKCGSF
jgi:hypothetical protein